MAEATDRRGILLQNLEDAGCSAEFIQKYLEISDSGGTSVRLRLLESQRKELLGQLHAQQRKLDCLDYLIYSMKNNKKKGK